jgi:DNA-binding NtrC family response regulator
MNIQLPDQAGLEAFRRIQEVDAKVPVVVITANGNTDMAIEAIKMGAYDYVLSPPDLPQLRDLLTRAFEVSRLMRVPALYPDSVETAEPLVAEVLVGRSAAMQQVYKAIGRVAQQDLKVLITGESGTGKELVARAVYHHSRRSRQPFLPVNCAAIPEALLESELFGHEKGSFTGADRRRIGKFEQCANGTLFLDEIGDMPLGIQSKILRVLQDQKFERVGGNETIETDVRIIAATHRDLEAMSRDGRFRSDLYYRLSTVTIRLPPLRERLEDLPLLVDYFLRRFNREMRREILAVSPEVIVIFRRYSWPGNLRELQSVLKQSLLAAKGSLLIPDFLPDSVLSRASVSDVAIGDASVTSAMTDFIEARLRSGSTNLLDECRALTETGLLSRVLKHTDGNLLQTAKILGIHRSTLKAKMELLGLRSSESNTPSE